MPLAIPFSAGEEGQASERRAAGITGRTRSQAEPPGIRWRQSVMGLSGQAGEWRLRFPAEEPGDHGIHIGGRERFNRRCRLRSLDWRVGGAAPICELGEFELRLIGIGTHDGARVCYGIVGRRRQRHRGDGALDHRGAGQCPFEGLAGLAGPK